MQLPNVTVIYSCFKNPEYIPGTKIGEGPKYYIAAKARAEVLQWNINKGSMRVRLIESDEFPLYKKSMGKITSDLSDRALLEEYPELEKFF